jgi:S-adenosylmethionine decarboxylase
MHLIIDGYGSNPEILKSEEFVYQLLDRYPAEIGMTKISTPVVVRYTGDDWGISGFVMIAESHISVHTFVERCFVNIDVFSCKDFDADRAIKDLCAHLQLTEIKTQLLDRDGKDLVYPDKKDRVAFVKP